ncbi:RES domain-containing protein [Rhodococcus globerulus]|uniref:RES domain-containing protein n=1 Tax=Rhodococcus globerulus TaxID=33008 RepID=UPI0027DECE87|nr:RES domain-containing protein [Rhodococcus globerulus]MCE4267263.1 RES domain-containing protein [Rhodococcus globerulus]
MAAHSPPARRCGESTAAAATRWHPIPPRNRTNFPVADSTPSTAAFAYLHIADSPDGAIAETICRDLPLDPTVARIVPASAVAGRTLTALTLTRTVTVAALHGPHLSAVGQDLWLTKCEARHYVTTRKWAHAIHAADPALGGLAYRPRHNE